MKLDAEQLNAIEARAKAATAICVKCGFTGRSDARGMHPNCGYLADNRCSLPDKEILALVSRARDAETAEAESARLRAEVEKLKKGLEPLAEWLGAVDQAPLPDGHWFRIRITAGHVRTAARLLADTDQEQADVKAQEGAR